MPQWSIITLMHQENPEFSHFAQAKQLIGEARERIIVNFQSLFLRGPIEKEIHRADPHISKDVIRRVVKFSTKEIIITRRGSATSLKQDHADEVRLERLNRPPYGFGHDTMEENIRDGWTAIMNLARIHVGVGEEDLSVSKDVIPQLRRASALNITESQ